VRLRDGGVGRGAGAGRERAEDAAEQEGERVDGDELCFKAGREEGRATVRGERRADGAGGHAAREGHGAVDCGLGFAARGHCWWVWLGTATGRARSRGRVLIQARAQRLNGDENDLRA
jgi:hypothetical protein